MVFYRKYRPKTLAELDNTAVSELLTRYLSRSEIPHAFIFIGPKGTGKTSTARILAKSINCPVAAKERTRIACGTCDVCERIARGEALDILEIDAASNRGIDEIRDLREKIKLSPTELPFKVYIIDEVHMLTTEAFNALLKTLEEPPRHAIFILATTETHKVPETILSRCVRVEFQSAIESDIIHSLQRIVIGEKLKITNDILAEVAKHADGSFRDAHKLLEELVLDGKELTVEKVRTHMGTSGRLEVDDFTEKLRKKEAKELLLFLQQAEKDGKNIRQFFIAVLKKLEQLLIEGLSNKGEWERKELLSALQLISDSFTKLKTSVIPTLPFEMAVVAYCESIGAIESKPAVVSSVQMVTPSGVVISDEKWDILLEKLKPLNHSIVGVLRSCKSFGVTNNELTIEAAFKFHLEKLDEPKVRELLMKVVSDVYGEEIKVKVVLKKRT